MNDERGESKAGLLYGIAAYGMWGAVPAYFKALMHVSALELLAQRIVWAAVLVVFIMLVRRSWGAVWKCLKDTRTRNTLILTTLLIATNWFVYIYGVSTQRVIQTSLGYFIAPLASTALGVVVLRERLRTGQVIALCLAITGVLILSFLAGEVPWLALAIAASFSLYGLLRKTVAADAMTGLTIESFFLFPFALGYVIWLSANGSAQFGHVDRQTDLLLIAGSVVTVAPLYCFAQAARQLRLTTIGFLQYLSPTGQFLLALWLFGETLNTFKLVGFVFVWMALAIYSVDALAALRRRRRNIDTASTISPDPATMFDPQAAKPARSTP